MLLGLVQGLCLGPNGGWVATSSGQGMSLSARPPVMSALPLAAVDAVDPASQLNDCKVTKTVNSKADRD